VSRWPSDDGTLPAYAGSQIERLEIQRWAQQLGRSYRVFTRQQFPTWLRRIFPGRSRPDMVAINPRQRIILVGDVTTQPNAAHLNKTLGYARQLARNLPPELRNHRVLAQERYWARPTDLRREWRLRGPGNMSRRFVVRQAEYEL
jgi:hypothetical protein